MSLKSTIFIIYCLGLYSLTQANNVQISNVSLASQNPIANYYMVEFDISWDNSWRTSTHESNWDAAWVFIKFTPKNEHNWQHAVLHYVNGTSDGHTAPPGASINTAINTYGTANQGRGIFIYRSSNGIGTTNFQNVQIRWDYGSLGDNDAVEISVHAIEMVYVPQGAFYAGDGTGNFGQFEAGNTGNPYLISSENSLTLGGTNSNNLSNHNNTNMLNADDYSYTTTRSLAAGFPKGYDAFYCMKYECSQQQYTDFLAKLSSTQRSDRNGPYYVNAINVFPIRTGNHYGEAENPWHAMDYISWQDMATYLDWAALRPMSELEYEKACRGPVDPIQNEYAWGNNSWYLDGLYSYANQGTANEIITDGIKEGAGNSNSLSLYVGSATPVRCGIFAASAVNKTRQETGATYWGIMEMSGNCYEMVISTGNSQSRDFDGLQGDGAVTGTGNASFTLLSDWAFVSAVGVGLRSNEVSMRYRANSNYNTRDRFYGIRGVRFAP